MKMRVPSRKLERSLWQAGHEVVIGMDEVGRGCAAGPVTVGAVVLPERFRSLGIKDSKLMTAKTREITARHIRTKAVAIGIGWSTCAEIDEYGLTEALRLAGVRALGQLGVTGMVILDGSHNYLKGDYLVTLQVKADQSCLASAAASVVAKVARDNYMMLLAEAHPEYGFESHKGYGSAAHLAALMQFGPSAHHRRRWQPVMDALRVN